MLCHQSTYRGYTIGVECKGSTGVLKRNVALAEIRFNQIYDVERGAASTLSTRYFASAMASVSDCAVALEQ